MTVPVHAQASSTNVSSPDVTLEKQELSEKETIQTKLDAVNSRISEWDKIDKSVFASRNGISETQVADHTARLNALVSYYRRIINALEKKETLTKERERIAATVEQPVESFVPDKPPYSLSYYQTYLRTLETIDEKIDTLKRSVAQTASATAAGTAAYEKARSRVRVLNEQVEKVESGSVPELDWEYRVAQTEEELYSAVVFFQKIKDANLRSEIDSAQLLRERDAKGVQWIREHLHYDETDLQTRVAELDKDIESIRKLINDLEAGKIAAEQELIKAQGAVEMAQTPEKVNLANLALKEQQVWWEYYQSRIEHSEEIIQYLVEAQNIWQTRYSLLNGEMETEALFDIRNRVTKRIETLESDLLEEQGRISSINTRLSAAEQALERNDAGKEVLKYLEGTARALEYYLEEDHLSYSSNLSMILSMNNRLLEEVETKLASVQIAEKVTTFGRERIFGILNTELWSGEGYSLTVRKLILAILILVIGLSITKRLTFALKNRLEKRNVEPSATMAIQKISYYILIITFILITLKMVNIPLTAFAFLGGALAIAIGFGAQNIFSNLITGFIIMFEKPFRVNDIVQVDGTVATVIEIGSRATTVRDFDNVDMMIPNSHFLNNNIINWTHSDKLIRGTVTVGVAYGSPAREVESLLLKVASDHSKVLKNPAPYVVFRDFGDSALVFELYFYVDMKNASRFFVASDLRYMVDNVFAKNNIVIAFPQMDVHVDMEGFPGSGTQESSEDKTSADLKGEPES
jgi:small-conductance mechanosensitive channel